MTMSEATAALDRKSFNDMPSLKSLSRVKPRDLPKLASKLDLIADIIEVNWTELPSPIKELAKTYAYHELENGAKPSFLDRLRFGVFMFRNITVRDDIAHLLSSMTRVTDAIFSAVERESAGYNTQLEQALESPQSSLPMNAEQFRAWSRSL
jgi:hypothetical protein